MFDRLKQPFSSRSQGGYVLLLTLVTSLSLFVALSSI
jgi:hypothetical protein